MNPSAWSLAALASKLAECSDERLLRRWLEALAADPRAGARALAARGRRALEARRADREHLARLFARRSRLYRAGAQRVAGVDEVGVGPLAGPVVAAAVVLPRQVDLPGLDDSKKLSAAARERLDRAIRAQAEAVGVGVVEAGEIDRMNVYRASLEAMRRAVAALPRPADHLLVDARSIPGVAAPQTALVHGDARDGSIAAASIVAKVYRDALMVRLERVHPGYGFARHKGYPTAAHLRALRRLGPTPLHRRSFAPVAAVLAAR